MKNQYRGGDCLKRAWTVCKFKGGRGLARKRGGGVFEGCVDTPMDTMHNLMQDSIRDFSFSITKNIHQNNKNIVVCCKKEGKPRAPS